jgi:hypothetical protein
LKIKRKKILVRPVLRQIGTLLKPNSIIDTLPKGLANMKKIISAIFLSAWISPVVSAAITDVITGADMVGMEVTATYTNGYSETLEWVMISNDPLTPYGEGYKGGVASDKFSLSQQGYTLGNLGPENELLGLWSLTNNYDSKLSSVVIDAMAGGIVFDRLGYVEGTPGSNVGRSFLHDDSVAVVGDYSNPYSLPDLWGKLTLYFADFGKGDSLHYMADTDRVRAVATVPEIDGSGASIALGLLAGFCVIGLEKRRASQSS